MGGICKYLWVPGKPAMTAGFVAESLNRKASADLADDGRRVRHELRLTEKPI